MADVTKRDLEVWSAYIGTALALKTKTHDLGDGVLKALAEAKAGIDEGKPNAAKIVKACEAGVAACDLEEGTHPVIASKVRVVRLNLQAVVDQIGALKSGRPTDEPTDDEVKSDGKVDCPCGKRHDEGSKVLARHMKAAS